MNTQFKKGVLELVVMMVVSREDIYGYELVKQVSDVVHVNEGTIYPLLKRMTNEKYFNTYLVESSGGPPRKYYTMSPLGKTKMEEQLQEWREFSRSINDFLERKSVNE